MSNKTYTIDCWDCRGSGMGQTPTEKCIKCNGRGQYEGGLMELAELVLPEFIRYCEWLETLTYKCSYKKPPMPFHKYAWLRKGVIFYYRGWGWRLHKGWRDALHELYSREDDILPMGY